EAVALFTLNEAQTSLSYQVFIFGLDLDGTRTPANPNDNIGGLHIHRAPAGVNGGIVFGMISPDTDLDGPTLEVGSGQAPGVATGDWDLNEGNMGATLASELSFLFTEGLYINIHTTPFPGGEIRGQIHQFG